MTNQNFGYNFDISDRVVIIIEQIVLHAVNELDAMLCLKLLKLFDRYVPKYMVHLQNFQEVSE